MEATEAVIELRSYTIEVGQGGEVRLPAQALSDLQVGPGDTLYLIRIDGQLIIAPRPLVVLETAEKIEMLLAEAGVTFDDLMETGKQVRARLFEEQYGSLARTAAGQAVP